MVFKDRVPFGKTRLMVSRIGLAGGYVLGTMDIWELGSTASRSK